MISGIVVGVALHGLCFNQPVAVLAPLKIVSIHKRVVFPPCPMPLDFPPFLLETSSFSPKSSFAYW